MGDANQPFEHGRGRRMSIIALIFGGLAVAILVRGWILQVSDSEEILERRDWRLRTEEHVVAPRGRIRDRNGVLLAESVQSHDVYLDVRGLYRDFPEAVPAVRAVLAASGFDVSLFEEWGETPQRRLTRHHRVGRQLSPSTWASLTEAEDELRINVFYEEPGFRRFYPEQELAGNLLGFVASDGVEGRSGIEAGLDEALRGSPVRYTVERDMRRKAYLFGDIPDLAEASGDDVEVTIDARLQRAVEGMLEDAVDEFGAREAMAVVSEVGSGDLLSVAAWPPFNPNHPFEYPADRLWVSRPLSHAYEPGSTIKVLTFAAALNEGVVDYRETIDCENGVIEIDGERVRDTHPEEEIPAWKVIEVSSNIGALKLGMRLDDEVHYRYLRAFGLGERPDLPVQGTAAGILEGAPWIDIKQANISFGHGLATTALQTHAGTATIANGGVRRPLRLIRAIESRSGDRIIPNMAAPVRVVREDVADLVTRSLVAAVEGEDGTGSLAALDGVRVAGKTGTAHLVDPERGGYTNEYLASFSGYFPAEDPRFVITVWVIEPDKDIEYYGGKVAAPVFREIAETCLSLYGETGGEARSVSLGEAVERYDLRVAEQTSESERGDSESDAGSSAEVEDEPPSWRANIEEVPDFSGLWLRDAMALAGRRGIEVEVTGAGPVLEQSVAPGTAVSADTTVRLRLGRQGVARAAP